MPRVDLSSPTNLLVQPGQSPKGRLRESNPFAAVLSSLDSQAKRGRASADPIGEPVETITREQPPASPVDGAGNDKPRAVDAEGEEDSAQHEPTQAQHCAPDGREPSVGATLDHTEAEADDSRSDSTVPPAIDHAVPVVNAEVMPHLPKQPQNNGTAEGEPTLNAAAVAPSEVEQVAPNPSSKAQNDKDETSATSSGPGIATGSSGLNETGRPQVDSPKNGQRAAGVVSTAPESKPAPQGVVVLKVIPTTAPETTGRAVNLLPASESHLSIEADQASEAGQRRPMARTRSASSSSIRPLVIPDESKPDNEVTLLHTAANLQPTGTHLEPVDQRTHDGDQQNENQKPPAVQPHHAVAAHGTLAPAAPAGQAPVNSAQAPTAPGGSQKAGPGNAISTSAAAPLSGAQVKQVALDRLTAQAPLLKQGIEQASFIPQAAKGLAMALKQSDGTITLKLTPGHLGALKIEVTLQGNEVAARLEPSTESARQLLMDSQSSLRAALEARGLSVERIEVTAPQGAPAQDARDPRNPGQHHDHPGAGFAGQGDPGRHTGRDAESFPGQQGKAIGHRTAASVDGENSWPMTQDSTITLALDNGGTYRLHLDAVA